MKPTLRPTLLAASLTLPALSLPAYAQEAPRVLFCSGQCFAVDGSGTRTPVAKGSELRPGQRLETGPGAYAQVRLGRVGLGLAENTRIRLDPGAIALDQGRLRAVTMAGSLPGVVAIQPPPIRTPDGDLAFTGGDIEIRKTTAPGTLVKLNAGDATLRSGAGEFKLPTEGIQNLQGGRLSLAPPAVARDLVLVPVRRDIPSSTTPSGTPTVRPPLASPILTRPIITTSFTPVLTAVTPPPPPPPTLPPLITRVVNTTLTNTTTGTATTLTEAVRTTTLAPSPTPTLTTLTTTKTVSPTTTPTTTTLSPTRTTFYIR